MATTRYLNADTGNDTTGTGTSASPWKTVSKANTSATAGDTIVLQNSTSTYTWATLTFSKSLTLIGESVGGAILDGGGANVTWSHSAYNITYENLIFQNAIQTTTTACFSVIGGVPTTATWTLCQFKDIQIYPSNFVHNAWESSLANASNSAQNLIFDRCLFTRIKQAVSGTASSLLGIAASGANVANLTMIGCTIHLEESTLPLKCILRSRNTGTGINSITIVNTIFNNTGASIPFISEIMSNTTATKSVTYSLYSPNLTGTISGTGNISGEDPLFIDTSTDDYNLDSGSPALNAGTLV